MTTFYGKTTRKWKDQMIEEAAEMGAERVMLPDAPDYEICDAVKEIVNYPRNIDPNTVFGRLILTAHSTARTYSSREVGIIEGKRSPYYD